MFIIEFTLYSGHRRYAQNRSETFDHSLTVFRKSGAKRFENVRKANQWLARNHLTRIPLFSSILIKPA